MATDSVQTEMRHVHEVYENIAHHFSSTRYKPWPIVERFLRQVPSGSCGLDVGCGNGKYLHVNKQITLIGSDRSLKLASIARGIGGQTIVADGLDLPHPSGRFDFAISIAVIHHFSSADRRQASIGAVLETLRPAAPFLIFVWALEQRESRRGWDEGSDQDVLVPWVTKDITSAGTREDHMYLRYYHLYRQGELESDIIAAGGKILDSGYDRDNWWAIAVRDISVKHDQD